MLTEEALKLKVGDTYPTIERVCGFWQVNEVHLVTIVKRTEKSLVYTVTDLNGSVKEYPRVLLKASDPRSYVRLPDRANEVLVNDTLLNYERHSLAQKFSTRDFWSDKPLEVLRKVAQVLKEG
jgi:hypothetical protein